MVASVKSVSQVFNIVVKYVPRDRLPELVRELRAVPGNKSFMDTIKLLEGMVEADEREENTKGT